MTDSQYNEQVRWMRQARTLTQQEVDERTRQHDTQDHIHTASERGAHFGV